VARSRGRSTKGRSTRGARRVASVPPPPAASGGALPKFSPRDFLRARRPYSFSDSSVETRPRLDRAFLEYFISKLTSRSQESDFETFARRLCEREVCPNLLPHTGPTGGGDSKVDSETYPVSLDIADAWYVGEARVAATERWAFAFSAKADWRSKLRADVDAMAGTGRGYTRYYFVTSQYVPDRTRSNLEDGYRINKALEVRILDLSWVLERVFSGGHEALATDTLHVEVEPTAATRRGPNDAERAARSSEYEARIASAVQAGWVGPQTIGLALESAIISRESERPRAEVEGKFERAARLASDYGLTSQERSAAYQRAWTAYWWFEAGPAFAGLYEDYESRVRSTTNAFELERLANLYTCARVGIPGRWSAADEWLEVRSAVLNEELERLESDRAAPSAALNARVTRLLVRLASSEDEFEQTLRLLAIALDDAKGLAGFAFEPLADLIGELGSVIPESPEFDRLHGRLVEQVRQSSGNAAAGERLLDRAVQLYRAGRRPEAITAAGRALPFLYTEEARGQLLRGLDLIGECYLAIGLPWAARGSWLLAASLAGSDAEAFGRGFPRLVSVLDRLRSVELRLGRLPESLAIHRLYRIVATVVVRDDESMQDLMAEADVAYEAVLANGLLNLDQVGAASLVRLPDFLGAHGLPVARASLLLVLGRDAELPEWLHVEAGGERTFLAALREAAGGVTLKIGPTGRPDDGVLETHVLGVRVRVEFEGSGPERETAESILAATESVMATTAGRGFFGFLPEVVVRIRSDQVTSFPWRVVDGAEDVPIELAVARFDPSRLTMQEQGQLREAVVTIVAKIIARGFHVDRPDDTLMQLFSEEGALARASNFTGSFVTAGDLYDSVKTGVDGLLSGQETEYLPTGIEPPWMSPGSGKAAGNWRAESRSLRNPLDLASLRHDQMRVESIINVPVWDRARWTGLGFFIARDGLPGVSLMFTDTAAASTIWREWHGMFGDEDVVHRLRLSIVTDVKPNDPFSYRVVVGPALESAFNEGAEVVFSISRVHEMNPISSDNLRAFRTAYERSGGCHLGIAILPPKLDVAQSTVLGSLYLSRVRFVAARDIGEQDLDVVALSEP
jgi:hypothetical protein